MTLDNLIFTFTIFYVIEFIIFFIGLKKSTKIKKIDNFFPSVSIIVAARNEEDNILNCLISLSKLNYPKEKLEIIIVNDQSIDRTEYIVKEFILNHDNFKLINSQKSDTHLRGKANAVMQGIEISHGDFVLFTDADCTVNPDWVRETISYFQQDVAIVGGYTILTANKIFEGIQTLDWIYLFNLASSSATLGFPLTGVGNNLAIRKESYQKVGGYRNIKFSVTEDYALTRAILDKTKYKMAFPLNPNAVVTSLPCRNIAELYHQKKRWGVGGLDMIPIGFLVFSIPYIFNILLLLSLLFWKIDTLIIPLLLKLFIDFLLLLYSLIKLRRLSYLKYFVFFEIYLIIYVVILPIVVLLSKEVKWKDRKL